MSVCHHTSVGVIVQVGESIAVARRQEAPRDLAPCAGHVELDDGLRLSAG